MKYFLLFSFIVLLAACKSPEPVPLTGDEPVAFPQFITIFPDLVLPFTVADSTMQRKEKDSTAIRPKLFAQFIPDSIQAKIFGKTRPKIYPLGKVKAKAKADATYLVVKTVAAEKKGAYLFAFDKKEKLIAYLPLLNLDNLASTQQNTVLDRKFAIYRNISRKNADGSISEGQDVFDLDPSAREFSLVMTDALDEKPAELVNPIDTFARKTKFAADYGSGKNNIVSFRDGRAGKLMFFIHLEKGADCNAELKGEAVMRSATMAEYRESGDPCAVQFLFTANAVTIKEIEGCGAHRGLRCTFNGSYARKKVSKPKAIKSKKL